MSACSDRQTVDVAFDRLRMVVATGDRARLLGVLDTRSQWAMHTVWNYQRQMAKRLDDLPAEQKEREGERLRLAQSTVSAADFFAATDRFGDVFARLDPEHRGLGARYEVTTLTPSRIEVLADSGLVVPMEGDAKGNWGWSGLQEDLLLWQDTTANDLKRIESDAELFRGH